MQFDDFYKTVGVFGRYQKVKYFLICLTYMLPPIMVYTWTFTAATPSFRCRISEEDMYEDKHPNDLLHHYIPSESQCREYQSQISLRECQRCYQNINKSYSYGENNGPLKACNSFIFDRTYYQSTLVEEWSMVCNEVTLKTFVQTIFFFGYMIGSLIFGILSDKSINSFSICLYDLTWRLLHTALAILSIPFLFFYFILPESPRWLISKGYYDEAEKILRRIAETNKNSFDLTSYQCLVIEEKKKEALASLKGHGLIQLLKSKIMCIIAINMSFQW
ncbi:unnamed protein product [Rotaria sp. Silwood2]|nr:unnamed protein product [Rotaria sp. Silwood2]